jgi:hypothetical protein
MTRSASARRYTSTPHSSLIRPLHPPPSTIHAHHPLTHHHSIPLPSHPSLTHPPHSLHPQSQPLLTISALIGSQVYLNSHHTLLPSLPHHLLTHRLAGVHNTPTQHLHTTNTHTQPTPTHTHPPPSTRRCTSTPHSPPINPTTIPPLSLGSQVYLNWRWGIEYARYSL